MAEKIGQILIRKGKITSAQLREALRTQQFFGGYLGSHLINLGFIEESSLAETLSEIYSVPFAPFESLRMAQHEAIARIPAPLAQRFRVVPLKIDRDRLHLAMLNPRDAVAINEVSSISGLTVTPWVAPEFRITQALERYYRLKRTGRGPISVRIGGGSDDGPAPAAAERTAAESRQAAEPARGEPGEPASPLLEGAELGFDGHPIHSVVIPETGGTVRMPAHDGPIPRSLHEWREESDAEEPPSNRPHPAALPHALESPAQPVRRPSPGLKPAESSVTARSSSAPAGLEPFMLAAASVTSRDELGREVVAFMGTRFLRAAAFVVKQDRILGWMGTGPGVEQEHIATIAFSVDRPSVFLPVLNSPQVYVGALPPGPEVDAFYSFLGPPIPSSILLAPIILADRMVAILYADNQADPIGPVDARLWERMAQVTAMSLEIQILRNRLLQL